MSLFGSRTLHPVWTLKVLQYPRCVFLCCVALGISGIYAEVCGEGVMCQSKSAHIDLTNVVLAYKLATWPHVT